MCGFEILPDDPVATAVLGGVERLIGKLDQDPMIYIPHGIRSEDLLPELEKAAALRHTFGDYMLVTGSINNDTNLDLLIRLADRFAALDPFTAEATEQAARELAEEQGVKVGVPINGARAAVTGQIKGPSMFEIFVHLGKTVVTRRLRRVEELFAAAAE